MGKNAIIFGADMSSSLHNSNVLILGERPEKVLDDTISILLIVHNQEKDLYKVFTVMEATVSYLLILKKVYQFKAKDSEIKVSTLCLGNISKDFIINNVKKKQD